MTMERILAKHRLSRLAAAVDNQVMETFIRRQNVASTAAVLGLEFETVRHIAIDARTYERKGEVVADEVDHIWSMIDAFKEEGDTRC